jgi:hypothetical protein
MAAPPGVAAPGPAGTQSRVVSQRPFAKQLGGSAPVASTPHRGARFAFDAMKSIGQWSCRGRSSLLEIVAPGESGTRTARLPAEGIPARPRPRASETGGGMAAAMSSSCHYGNHPDSCLCSATLCSATRPATLAPDPRNCAHSPADPE